MKNMVFTSESVTEGHPDKLCDAISDAVLDACLAQDKESRVACEVCATTGYIHVMGEITTKARIDIEKIARQTALRIGYDEEKKGLNGNTCRVEISVDTQSEDIALGVNRALKTNGDEEELGAGDQGMVFGYATDETEDLMPYPIVQANKLAKRLTEVRKTGLLPYLRPDGKSQVSVLYGSDGKPKHIETIVVSAQHDESVSQQNLRGDIMEQVIRAVISTEMLDDETKIYINPTGRFIVGGPHGDTGLTGRKIIVDTYGGFARHGGGAFSGKDPTKVDRSGAYAARYVAKNIVAAHLAKRCEVQIAYAIGVAEPVSLAVNTFGTGKMHDKSLCVLIRSQFDLRPSKIIEHFGLQNISYEQMSAYGHFGRIDTEFPWEKTDKANKLRAYTDCNL